MPALQVREVADDRPNGCDGGIDLGVHFDRHRRRTLLPPVDALLPCADEKDRLILISVRLYGRGLNVQRTAACSASSEHDWTGATATVAGGANGITAVSTRNRAWERAERR